MSIYVLYYENIIKMGHEESVSTSGAGGSNCLIPATSAG